MICYYLIKVWKDFNYINFDIGKNGIVFSLFDGFSNKYYEFLELFCGCCIGCCFCCFCDWFVRCMVEVKFYK